MSGAIEAQQKIEFLEFHVNAGAISIEWNTHGLITRIDWKLALFPEETHGPVPPAIRSVAEKIKRYFESGDPIGRVPWEHLDQSAWTPFQAQVYRAASDIPHGETRTYGWIASRVGNAFATRAVGQSLRNNPLPILIPCHRVVSVTSIGGFMGIIDPNRPEMDLKRKLQGLEQEYLNPPFEFMSFEGAIV